MGLETQCNAIISGRAVSGKLHVDSKELIFQSKALKWKLPLKPAPKTTTNDGWLQVPGAKFELGPAAAKWLDKILNPPSRLTKLGITQSTTLWIGGEAPRDFLHECQQSEIPTTGNVNKASTAIYFLSTPDQLHAAPPPTLPLWLIYPKGGKTIKESDVMAWAKQNGVGASKTLSFDAKLTGLRFGSKKS